VPQIIVVEDWWRRHFEQRARWATDEADASAWSIAGLTARLALFARLSSALIASPASAVLDLGCGAGTYAGWLGDQGHHVTAMDYAFEMVCRARVAHDRARFVVADGYHAPFRSDTFDAVLCIGVLQFCAEPEALIAEAARLTRPGGIVLVESLNPFYFAVPAIKVAERVRYRRTLPLQRHAPRVVERALRAAGIAVSARVPLYVVAAPDRWTTAVVGAITRCLRRIPGLRGLAASALWWYGAKQAAADRARSAALVRDAGCAS
jgi:SAM-dependent methyltransferase